MRNVAFGSGGSVVPVIGQGTWYFEQLVRGDAVRALQKGISLGLLHIDTAEMYGVGVAEEIVGEAIDGQRDEVFLVSKVLPWNASYDDTIAACEASLRRLKTDRLDSYLLHWRGQYPLDETFAAMDKLVDDGKIRSFGVSNFDADDLSEALEVVGHGKLACNQVLYHLGVRAIEHEVLPWCAANDVSIVAYSPFGHNAFPNARSPGGRVLTTIAKKHDVTEREVALGFLARTDNVLLIPKSSNPQHLQANARAGSLTLDDDDVRQLDAAFPLGDNPGYLPML